jgi:predicted PurR-regulated permease PerM
MAMSSAAKVHPFVTLLALLLFSSMFGILGAILSIPLVLAIGTIIEVLWVEETLGAEDDEIEPIVKAKS